ncbi:hypothetical protein [Glaciecola sp. 1036]|uniref:hypothetical protein n=1 Tax=Alteromonadaceae TaxID=72275 RepID=UPI003D070E5C
MRFAIQDAKNRYLGFIVFAGNEQQGECVFRPLPKEVVRPKSENLELLYRLQDIREFSYVKHADSYYIFHESSKFTIKLTSKTLLIDGLALKVTLVSPEDWEAAFQVK